MTTYTWTFPQFDVVKAEDGLTDVVQTIHWRYDAVDGDYSAGAYGTVGLGAPDPANFVPFADITEAWTIDQVTASVDLDAMNANLEAQIATLQNPPVVPMVPPFAQ